MCLNLPEPVHIAPCHKLWAVKEWDGTTLADAKPQVRGCACGMYTPPVLAAPFLPRLFLKQLPDNLCTKYPAKIRARLSGDTLHQFHPPAEEGHNVGRCKGGASGGGQQLTCVHCLPPCQEGETRMN